MNLDFFSAILTTPTNHKFLRMQFYENIWIVILIDSWKRWDFFRRKLHFMIILRNSSLMTLEFNYFKEHNFELLEILFTLAPKNRASNNSCLRISTDDGWKWSILIAAPKKINFFLLMHQYSNIDYEPPAK